MNENEEDKKWGRDVFSWEGKIRNKIVRSLIFFLSPPKLYLPKFERKYDKKKSFAFFGKTIPNSAFKF